MPTVVMVSTSIYLRGWHGDQLASSSLDWLACCWSHEIMRIEVLVLRSSSCCCWCCMLHRFDLFVLRFMSMIAVTRLQADGLGRRLRSIGCHQTGEKE